MANGNELPRIAIHVRRGDYVNNSANHTDLSRESYYLDAIHHLFSEQIGNAQIVVFSDNPDWCESAFEGAHIMRTSSSYVDMCAMSMCNHYIIANSSFSWWGAWLNPSPNKIVTAPMLWFGPNLRHYSTKDILPEDWFFV
jgi:hypothetical protein